MTSLRGKRTTTALDLQEQARLVSVDNAILHKELNDRPEPGKTESPAIDWFDRSMTGLYPTGRGPPEVLTDYLTRTVF